jgi:hypothetical protein
MKAIGTNIIPENIKNIASESSTFFWIYNGPLSLHHQSWRSNANCQKNCAMYSNNCEAHCVKGEIEMLLLPWMAPNCQHQLGSIAFLVCLQPFNAANQNKYEY